MSRAKAGAVPGTPVEMTGAASRDAYAAVDLAAAAELLSDVWGAPARVAVLSGDGAPPSART